jgi:ubiquinone/menaquinone biosynthesis C-methylase UbiE
VTIMRETAPFNPNTDKEIVRRQWDAAAKAWNDWGPQLRAWLGGVTQTMLVMADVKAGSRVLDVAAGAGDQTHDIARRVGKQGYVLATDISAGILKFAEENTRDAGHTNVGFRVCDGEQLGLAEGGFDAAVCRLGLMFYAHPLKGLSDIHQALRPNGRLCTMVFSVPEQNPCLVVSTSVACKHAGVPPQSTDRPGRLMCLGKPGLIADLFRQAGYNDVETRICQVVFKLDSAREFVDFTKFSRADQADPREAGPRSEAGRMGGNGREIEGFRDE